MKHNKGFTLIELMVVVAVIALLVAIMIPAYTGYMNKSKIGAVMKIVEGFVHKAVTLANMNGHFPDGNVLVNPTARSTRSFVSASQISPYLNNLAARDFDIPGCGRAGHVSVGLNTTAMGITGLAGNIVISCLLATKGSSTNTKCYYTYSTNSSGTSTSNSTYRLPVAGPPRGNSNIFPELQNAGNSLLSDATSFFAGTNCIH